MNNEAWGGGDKFCPADQHQEPARHKTANAEWKVKLKIRCMLESNQFTNLIVAGEIGTHATSSTDFKKE